MIGLEQYVIFLDKYETRGIVNHSSVLNISYVEFLYDKTYYNRKIETEWPEGDEDAIKVLGVAAMEEYLAQIISGEVEMEKVRLYNWYVEKMEREGKEYLRAHGNVTGHYQFWDSEFIHTSSIESIEVKEENAEEEQVSLLKRDLYPAQWL